MVTQFKNKTKTKKHHQLLLNAVLLQRGETKSLRPFHSQISDIHCTLICNKPTHFHLNAKIKLLNQYSINPFLIWSNVRVFNIRLFLVFIVLIPKPKDFETINLPCNLLHILKYISLIPIGPIGDLYSCHHIFSILYINEVWQKCL